MKKKKRKRNGRGGKDRAKHGPTPKRDDKTNSVRAERREPKPILSVEDQMKIAARMMGLEE